MNDNVANQYQNTLTGSELGKTSDYHADYNPDKLFAIPRAGKRREIGIDPDTQYFYGFDCWNHYEVSWLNQKGKPMVAIAEIYYDCNTPNILESKSLKLYFNSLNDTEFNSQQSLIDTIKHDLEVRIGGEVHIILRDIGTLDSKQVITQLRGICLDNLDIECNEYMVNPKLLITHDAMVDEVVHSNLLRSNCLITNQPDWGSVEVAYQGQQIDHASLLKYLVSFRHHNEFHEQCIERIYADIMQRCAPNTLTVYGRYTRRGGLDINPYRSTQAVDWRNQNQRLIRQ